MPESFKINVVADRADIAGLIPSGGVGAEIGVWRGDHAAVLLGLARPRVLHLVDTWSPSCLDSAWGDFKALVESRFVNAIADGTVQVHQISGFDWLSQQADSSLDWVYLDSSHEYDDCRLEMEQSLRAVKPGGVIAGHDFCVDPQSHWVSGPMRSVLEAIQSGDLMLQAIDSIRHTSWIGVRM